MISLSDQLTVPQVFFNEDHIGGSSELFNILSQWDEVSSESDDNTTTSGPLQMYFQEIESQPDPTDVRLALSPPESSTANQADKNALPTDECAFGCFLLPDGQIQSVRELTADLINFMPRQTLPYYAKYYVNCFRGNEGVDALMKHYPSLKTRSDAVAFGLALQQYGVFHHVCDEHPFNDTPNLYFRLQPYHTPNVLNSFRKSVRCSETTMECLSTLHSPEALDPMELVYKLKSMLSTIVSRNTNEDGVDYHLAKKDRDYERFEETACEIQCVDMTTMDDNTKLAFGINLYNVMIHHAFIKVGIPENGAQRCAFYGGVCYNVGGHILSFDDLEHGILRANMKKPYAIKAPFPSGDKRKELVVSNPDPRIHFALNCGANSCPPISRYTPAAIDEELRIAAMSFCENDRNVSVNVEKMELELTMILKWYRADFAPSASKLPEKLVTYLRGQKREQLQTMLDGKKAIKIKYFTYDWGTNATRNKSFCSSSLETTQNSLTAVLKSHAKREPFSPPSPPLKKLASQRVADSLSTSFVKPVL